MTTEPQRQVPDQPPMHNLAIISLILSILGFVPILPLIGPIAGIITGTIARKEVLARPDLYSGEGTARAGIILGWIGVGLALALCLLIVFGLTVLTISSSTISTLPAFQITIQP
jgi:hypothetical protein